MTQKSPTCWAMRVGGAGFKEGGSSGTENKNNIIHDNELTIRRVSLFSYDIIRTVLLSRRVSFTILPGLSAARFPVFWGLVWLSRTEAPFHSMAGPGRLFASLRKPSLS